MMNQLVIAVVNGREILACKPGYWPNTQIVLARWKGQYVTWSRNVDFPSEFCSGRYHNDYGRAMADFNGRV